MEKDVWKIKYLKLRKKYQDLLAELLKLKSIYEKLKENNEIDIGEIKFLRKENEYLKLKFKNSKKSQKRPSDSIQLSVVDEQISQYFVKPTTKIESTGKITQANPDQSIYPDPSVYIYQSFFIVGPTQIVPNLCVAPEILFEYYPSTSFLDLNVKSLIPSLCFPQQIMIEKSNNPEEVLINLKQFQFAKRTSQQFVVTLRNESVCSKNSDIPNSEHEVFYVICLQIYDYLSIAGVYYSVPKCYCIVSFIPAFELHFDILNSLHYLRKISQSEETSKEKYYKKKENISQHERFLLDCYADCEELYPGRTITVGIEKSGMICYKVPKDLSKIDVIWTCIALFGSISFKDFFWLVCAIVQEKSVVFMSTNLGLVTSCVLGICTLLRPFKWPNLIVPLVPDCLHELLEAPIPLLVGTAYVSPITRHSLDTLIWVVLDECNLSARVQSSSLIVEEVVEPKNFERKNELEKLYSAFIGKKLFEGSQELNEKCLKIVEIWNQYWTEIISNEIHGISSERESLFIESVRKTQMFNSLT